MRLLTWGALLFFYIFFCPSFAVGQERTFHHHMDGESVTRIMKTDAGFMLLGTDNGLFLYDGNVTERIETADCHRPFNFVNDLLCVQGGQVLAAMRQGLYEVDLTERKCRHIVPSLTETTSLILDSKNRVWVACRQGLALLDRHLSAVENIVKVDPSNVTSPDNQIVCATMGQGSHIWMANGRGLLYRYDTASDKTIRYAVADGLLSSAIECMECMGDRLYIGTLNSGLIEVDTEKGTAKRIEGISSSVKRLHAVDGRLYVCTDGGGACLIESGRIIQRPATDNSVYSCHVDTDLNSEWYGYYQNGFSCAIGGPSPFSVYHRQSFDSRGIYVRSFYKQGDEIVVGTRQGLYYVDERRGIMRHFTARDLGCAIITDIKYFAGGYIFTSYERGVYRLDPQKVQVTPLFLPQPYRESSCNSLILSPDSSRLYVGSSRGLLVLDRQLRICAAYDSRHSDILGSYIYDMILDKGGKLWISTVKGMCIFNTQTEKFQDHEFPDGFWHREPNLTFFSSLSGDILAASERSLFFSRSDLSSFGELSVMQRLGLGQVSLLSAFGHDYLVGTDKGLFVFDSTFTSFSQYNESDGLPVCRFSRYDALADSDGGVWMATARGLVRADFGRLSTWSAKQRSKVMVSAYTLGDKERSTRKVHILSDGKNDGEPLLEIDVPWHFSSSLLTVMPSQPEYSGFGGYRYYEWQIDDGEKAVAFESHPIVIQGLMIGNHVLSVRQAGCPSTTTLISVRVRPSVFCYIELLVLSLLAALCWMALYLRKRRRLYSELNRQKHRMEIELAAALAVSRHKQEEEEQREQDSLKKRQEKDEQVRQRSQNYSQLHEKVEKYMRDKQPYLDANLRLSDIAEHTGTNVTTLSQMFNDYLHTSYFEYVNSYRISHFKRIALDPAHSQLTLIALSEMCGFKRSSFFNVFKKMEGCTPNEWMKGLKSEG